MFDVDFDDRSSRVLGAFYAGFLLATLLGAYARHRERDAELRRRVYELERQREQRRPTLPTLAAPDRPKET